MMASKPFVLRGTPDQEQVLRIVCGQEVTLDEEAASWFTSASPRSDSERCNVEKGPRGLNGSGSGELNRFQIRAALLGQLVSLVYGKSSARLSVVEALKAALNENTLILSGDTTDSALNRQIAEALAGKDGLSKAEQLAIERSQASSRGIASFVVALAEPILTSATAVAALSCEALEAQMEAFEGRSGTASPYPPVARVAQDLKGLLIGSTGVNHKKDVDSLYSINSVPEVHGTAEAACEAAAATVRTESAVGCPARKDLERMRPSMQLFPKVLELGKSLRAAACLSMARSLAYGSTAACFEGRLEELQAEAGLLMHSMGEIYAMSGAADATDDVNKAWTLTPDLGAALLADDCLRLLQKCINIEACLALVQLRKQLDDAEEAAIKNKSKKKSKKDEGREVVTGVSELRAYLEGLVQDSTTGPATVQDQTPATSTPAAMNGVPQPSEDSKSAQSTESLEQTLEVVSAALEPLNGQSGILLDVLEGVIQANMPERTPKVPKGARDFGHKEMTIRKPILKDIEEVFERHGGKALETPVFELSYILKNKYGEDGKLIYELADQGGELLALRYDHTVPKARYVAQNNGKAARCYSIGRVYRRDNPQATRARYREFYQADFDIVGEYPPMAADAEVLKILVSILSMLKVGDFIIKISHRKLLDAMLTYCGVPAKLFHPICSAIDKLDKESWETVRAEMIEQKGLPAEVADRIEPFTKMKGDMRTMIKELKARDWASCSAEANKAADVALKDMELLSDLLEAFGINLKLFSLNLSLARGLDYYTGLIYEAVLDPTAGSAHGNMGSIAAGGRYDKMVGQFSSKTVPCVGVFVGVERVFAILEREALKQAEELGANIRESKTQVLIVSPGRQNLLQERCKLADQLLGAGFLVEAFTEKKMGFMDQIKYADVEGIPVVVVMGEKEIQKGVVKIRDQWRKKDDPDKEIEVPRTQLVEHLQKIRADNGAWNAQFTKPSEAF